jgi:hypothetical protein
MSANTENAPLQNAPETRGLRDSLGRLFDPVKFLRRFDRVGRWINARAGRRKKNAPPRNAPAPENAPVIKNAPIKRTAPMETPETQKTPETPAPGNGTAQTPEADFSPPRSAISFADIEAAAKNVPPPPESGPEPEDEPVTTAETIIGIIQTALILVGDSEGVLSEPEKTLLRRPLERVLKKYNVGDDVMPPEVDLAVALAGIIIVRLKKPKTATFAGKVRAWFIGTWNARRGEKIAQQVQEATAPGAAA